MFKRFLGPGSISLDAGLLIIRGFAGISLLAFHGATKLIHFTERKDTFSDPLGVGSTTSLVLAIFAECLCSLLLTLGLFTRAVLVPLIILMSTLILVVHADDTLKERELPMFYLMTFIGLFLAGPGSYSLDATWRK